jgi:thiol:disulfide interchange protein
MQAIVFCLGIVVLFTCLGLLMKAVAGPFGVVLLGSNPWVNGFIVLVFIVFGLSLLGAYELTLPSGLLTRLDSASRGGGYMGTLLMGLTFSLTSFACVGPIVGPLVVASVNGDSLQPVLGMMCFAAGLAAPFFLLALFPSYLKRLPRSGGWMSRVKVVAGICCACLCTEVLRQHRSSFATRDSDTRAIFGRLARLIHSPRSVFARYASFGRRQARRAAKRTPDAVRSLLSILCGVAAAGTILSATRRDRRVYSARQRGFIAQGSG